MPEQLEQMEDTEKLRSEIREEVEKEFTEKFKTELEDARKELSKKNEEVIQKAIEEWRKEQKPPSNEDLQKLLSQEYVTLQVKLMSTDGEKEFILRELPQDVEKRFFAAFRDVVTKHAKDIGALTQDLLEGDVVEKIRTFVSTFEPTLDMMAEWCAVSLNPFGEEEGIDKKWVQRNISTSRIFGILRAQAEVNRLRDFFSQLSQFNQT